MKIRSQILFLTALLLTQPAFASSTDTEEPDVVMMESDLNQSKDELNEYATVKLTNEKRTVTDSESPQVSVVDAESNKVLKFDMEYPVAYIRLPEGNYKMIINDDSKQDVINITSSYDKLASYQF